MHLRRGQAPRGRRLRFRRDEQVPHNGWGCCLRKLPRVTTAIATQATLAGRSQRLRGIALSCWVVSTVTTPPYTISSYAAGYITAPGYLPVGSRVGTQPHRDVRRLHRLPDHLQQIVAQSIEVRLFSELGGEALEGLSGIILLAVEAPVYERLYAPSQRVEQGGDHESRGHDRERWISRPWRRRRVAATRRWRRSRVRSAWP